MMKKRGLGSPNHPLYGKARELQARGLAVQRQKIGTKLVLAFEEGLENLSENQWQEVKNGVLLATVTNPQANAGASLKAIELMDRQRERAKFGTEEALIRTLKECEARLAEVREIERMAAERGGGAAGTTEDTTTEGATNGA